LLNNRHNGWIGANTLAGMAIIPARNPWRKSSATQSGHLGLNWLHRPAPTFFRRDLRAARPSERPAVSANYEIDIRGWQITIAVSACVL
jgi:hypothetical protein